MSYSNMLMSRSAGQTLRVKLRRLHPAQRDVMDSQSRFNVLCMGRRWGKSSLGLHIIHREIQRGKPVGWFAPKFDLFMQAWRDVLRAYEPIVLAKNSQTRRIDFIGGGYVDFWSLSDPGAVARGRAYSTVIIDEAAMAPYLEDGWQQSIRPTLTDYAGSAWFLSTPKGLNYFHDLYQLGETERDWARWQLPTSSNPFISHDEIEAARLELPALIFAQEYLAQFVTLEGGRVRREWLRYGEPPTGKVERYMGVDLAISTREGADYTAIAVVSRLPDGAVYVHDVQRARLGFGDVLGFINSMAQKWQPALIGIEQVQYQAAVVEELLRRTKLPVRGVYPDRDKLSRFQPLEARYQQGLVIHSRNLPREFDDELLSFPHAPHDDQIDALSYAYSLIRTPPLSERGRRAFSEV